MKTTTPRALVSAAICGALFITGCQSTSGSHSASSAPSTSTASMPAPVAMATPVPGVTTSYNFSFGPGDRGPSHLPVAATAVYSDQVGYGFEPGAAVVDVAASPNSKGSVTSNKTFYFSVELPEGNYKVTATLGNPTVAVSTTVKAELRRLMLENVETKPGELVTKTFIVNVRRPEIVVDGKVTGSVKLKTPRENNVAGTGTTEDRAWDNKLTLEFDGAQPSLASLAVEKVDVPTVFVIGDSTSTDQPLEPFNSWGQMITRFFKPEVAVANHGESGETIGDNLGRRRFDKIWSVMKPGDYVFITSGHNEVHGKDGSMTYDQRFYDDCKRAVDGTLQRGGIPVLVSPISRAPGGPSLGPYPGELQQLATDEKIAFIDLQAPTATFYRALPDYHVAFATRSEATHNSDYASYQVAKMVIAGIKQNNLPLAKYIVDDFTPVDPAKPDPFESFKIPNSPTRGATVTPAGS